MFQVVCFCEPFRVLSFFRLVVMEAEESLNGFFRCLVTSVESVLLVWTTHVATNVPVLLRKDKLTSCLPFSGTLFVIATFMRPFRRRWAALTWAKGFFRPLFSFPKVCLARYPSSPLFFSATLPAAKWPDQLQRPIAREDTSRQRRPAWRQRSPARR
jgi:hypothetical protein